MYSSPVIKLQEDPTRLAIKATIKRGSKTAQAALAKLDTDSISALTITYEQARDDIRNTILSRSNGSGTLSLQVLDDLLGQVNQRLDQLSIARNRLIDDRLLAAARIGTDPVAAANVGINIARINEDAVRFVHELVAEDGLQLTDRLWRIDAGAKEAVGQVIQSSIIQGHSASEAAQQLLSRGESVPGDLVNKMQMSNAARVAGQASGALMAGKGNSYRNALRVMRTEIGRANNYAFETSVFEVPDTIGTRFRLSPNHPKPDICDMHASVNRYGLGPGVYPKGKNPYPAHPETISYMEVVFSDEVEEIDRESKEDRITWLNKQSGTTQELVLGSRKKRAALESGLLKENQIATPWNVLKERYQRIGIDVDGLQVKPVPLSTVQIKDDLVTKGPVVSKAFSGKPFPTVQKRVMSAIDSVHGDGKLPVIPIKKMKGRTAYGSYNARPGRHEIKIRASGDHKDMTLAHEIGHFLDQKGFSSEGMSSTYDPIFDEWKKAIAKSRATQSLVELATGPDVIKGYSVPKKHLIYLLQVEELWARSYAQYIAVRSGENNMLKQLKEMIDSKKQSPIVIERQWDEDDFGDIASEIDKMFIKLGWIKRI